MIGLIERVLAAPAPGRGDGAEVADRATGGGALRLLFRHGGAGPADTDQAIVWRGADGPSAVVKIARGPVGLEVLAHERRRLERFAVVHERRPDSLPRVLGFLDAAPYALLAESHLAGRRMKDLAPDAAWDRLEDAADWLLDFNQAVGVGRVALDGPELAELVDEPIARYRREFRVDAAEAALLATLPERLRGAVGHDSIPLVAGHGDFSDANLLIDGQAVRVVDWSEPRDRALPGSDLFYLLCSLVATRYGLGSRDGFEQAFVHGFFSQSDAARRYRAIWRRHRQALGLPAAATLPLFAAAWVGFAVAKLDYLDARYGRAARAQFFDDPGQDFPLSYFADGHCLNVAMTAARAGDFAE